MSASYDLFCRWKHVQKIQSDNAGALALGVSRATVSLWKQGKNAEIHYVERMAVDIGDSPEMWSAVVMAERSNSEDEKAAWRRIAQKLATFALALCLAVGFSLPRDARASVHLQGYENDNAVYIMRNAVWQSETGLAVDPSLASLDEAGKSATRRHVNLQLLQAKCVQRRRSSSFVFPQWQLDPAVLLDMGSARMANR